MNCPSCGHENPDHAKFWLDCASSFPIRCASCPVCRGRVSVKAHMRARPRILGRVAQRYPLPTDREEDLPVCVCVQRLRFCDPTMSLIPRGAASAENG